MTITPWYRLAAVALFLLLSQGTAFAQKGQDDFAIPEEILQDVVLDGSKTQVIIYYANETRPTANLNQLAEWFAGSDNARIRKIGERLKQDAKDFPDVIASEAEAIRAATASKTKPFAVAIFNNALARDGKFLYLSAGTKTDNLSRTR